MSAAPTAPAVPRAHDVSPSSWRWRPTVIHRPRRPRSRNTVSRRAGGQGREEDRQCGDLCSVPEHVVGGLVVARFRARGLSDSRGSAHHHWRWRCCRRWTRNPIGCRSEPWPAAPPARGDLDVCVRRLLLRRAHRREALRNPPARRAACRRKSDGGPHVRRQALREGR